MIITKGEARLECSGRILKIDMRVIGVEIDGDGLDLLSGYDNAQDCEDLTPEERAEVADFAIAQWERWKQVKAT